MIIVIIILLSIFLFLVNENYITEWYEWTNINNEIYLVNMRKDLFHTYISEKQLIEQKYIRIIEVLDNKAIGRYIITNEDIPLIWKNNKWLISQ